MKKLILTALATITLSFSAFADKYYFDSALTIEDIYIAETNLATYLENAVSGGIPEKLKKVMAAINYETESPGLVYEEREDGEDLWVTGYEREDDSELLVIPAYHNGKKVNIAGNADFDYEEITTLIYWGEKLEDVNGRILPINLKSLILPNVKIVPDGWFGGRNITSLYAPNVERIGQGAFSGTKLSKIDLPSLKYAGTDAFRNTPATEVIVPELLEMNATMFGPNVTYLYAPKVQRVRGSSNAQFQTCFSSITNLYLPSCEEFGNHCFYGSEEFPKHIYAPKLKRMGKDNWLPGLVEIDFPMCTDWEAKMVIPEYKGRPEHHKQYYYPDNTSLTRVVLGVEQLRDHAFRRCTELQAVEMPNLIQGGRWAFEGCTNLFYADLPKMTKSAWGMFQNCSKLGYVNIQNSLDIEGEMFFGCERIHQVVDEATLKAVYGEYTIEDVCKPFTRIVEDEETGEECEESYYKEWQEQLFQNYNYLAVVASKVKTVGKKAFSVNRDKKEEKTDETSGWIFLQGKDIRDVATTDGKTIYVAVYNDGIYKSTDGGISWNWIINYDGFIKLASYNDIVYLNNTEYDSIYKSTNGCKTFDHIGDDRGCSFAIATSDGNTIFIGYDGGKVFKSTDGGDNLEMVSNWSRKTTTDIVMQDNNTVYVCCPGSDEIFVSNNQGESWDQLSDNWTFNNIAVAKDGTLYAATTEAVYVNYNDDDRFNDFVEIENEIIQDDNIISLDCSSDGKTIYVVTDANEMFIINRTGDSPDNYEYEINYSAFSRQTDFTDVTSISTCDGKTIYVANPGSDGAHKSEDGGKTWNWIISGETINRVYSPNENIVYLQLGQEIWKSIDGGQSYDTIYTFDKEYDIEAFGGNGNTLCFYSSGGDDLFISIDGGESWIDRTGTAGGSSPCISITKDDIIFILSDNHIIYKSSDYGENWEYFEIDTESYPFLTRIEAIDENTLYGLTDDPFFVKSIDGGHTWLLEPLDMDFNIGNNICKDKFGNIYGVKSNGDIYKHIPESDSIRSAEEDEQQSNGNLEVIELPTLETIGTAAFKNQTHLHSIQVPRCEVIRPTAFKNCGSADLSVYKADGVVTDEVVGYTALVNKGIGNIDTKDGKILYAVVANEGIWKSTDGGESWNKLEGYPKDQENGTPEYSYSDVSCSLNGEIVYACYDAGSDGRIIKSLDGGKTWKLVLSGHTARITGIETTDGSFVYSGGANGGYISYDGGESWPINTSCMYPFDIAIKDNLFVYTPYYNNIQISKDYGATFENISDFGSGAYGVTITDSKDIFVAANDLTIKVSYDEGDTWETYTEFPDGISECYGLTSSPDGKILYFVGDNSLIKIIKNGNEFTYEPTAFVSQQLTKVTSFSTLDGNTIYIVANGVIYKSENGGKTWEEYDNSFNNNWYYVSITDNNNVIYAASGIELYVKEINDDEWIRIGQDKIGDKPITALQVTPDNTHVYVACGDYFYREDTDGYTWTDDLDPGFGSNIEKLSIGRDGTICAGYGGGDAYSFWISTNKGDNWTKIENNNVYYYAGGICLLNKDIIYTMDDEHLLDKSIDGGKTFNEVFSSAFSSANNMYIDTNNYLYIWNVENGTIYKLLTERPAKETEISYGPQKPKARFIESVDFSNVRKIGLNTFVNCGFGYLNFIKNNDNREYYLEAWHDVDLSFPSMSEIPPMSSFTNSVKIGNVTFGTGLIVKDKNNEFTAITIGDRAEDSIVGPYSIAHGTNTVASGDYSIASGENVKAIGLHSIAIGKNAEATGENAVSIGKNTQATGEASHAEGGGNAEVEGYPTGTAATGEYAHSEGTHTLASGAYAHAEGSMTIAGGKQSHSEGWRTQATGTESHAEGYNTSAFGNRSHAEGANTIASNSYAHAEGNNTKAINESSHAEGSSTTASGENSHSEGEKTQATSLDSHAEGRNTKAFGQYSHAEGDNTAALGNDAHSEGNGTYAVGSHSHSEGYQTFAIANQTHTEGNGTLANATRAHAEGYQTAALGIASHSEGIGELVSGASNKKTILSRIHNENSGEENPPIIYNSSVNFSTHWAQAIFGIMVVNTNSVYVITNVSGSTIYLNKVINVEDESSITAYCTMWKYGAKGYSSHVAGYKTKANSDYSWVWNGNNSITDYTDNGDGTFNINPTNGASGFYIGNQSLQDYLDGVQPDLSNYSITINGDEQTLDSNPNFTIDIPPDLSANTITINGEEQTFGNNPTYRLDKIEKEISNNGTIDLSTDKNELYFFNLTENETNYIILPQSDYNKLGKITIYVEENPEENAYYDFSGALSDSFTSLETKPWLTSTNNSTWKFELISPPGNIKWSCDTFKEYVKDDISKTIAYYSDGTERSYDISGQLVGNSIDKTGLTGIEIGTNITSIGNSAFQDCSSLTNVVIYNGVTSIEPYAFYNCSGLMSVTIPDSVTRVGRSAFSNCASTLYDTNSISGVHLVDGWVIGNQSPSGDLDLMGIRGIGDSVFLNCSGLTSVTIPDNVTSIGKEAFYSCSGLTNVTIPDSVISIEPYAFYYCSSLTNITIPDSVTRIGDQAFYGCRGLTSVKIGTGVMSIGSYAFSGCSWLSFITCLAVSAPTVVSNTFGNSISTYTGRNTYSTGNNVLRIPQGATGYNSSYWNDPLRNSNKCGFRIGYITK